MTATKSLIPSSVRFQWWQLTHPALSILIQALVLLLAIAICSFFVGRATQLDSGWLGVWSTLQRFVTSGLIWLIVAAVAFAGELNRRKPRWKRFLGNAKKHDPKLAGQFEELARRDGLIPNEIL